MPKKPADQQIIRVKNLTNVSRELRSADGDSVTIMPRPAISQVLAKFVMWVQPDPHIIKILDPIPQNQPAPTKQIIKPIEQHNINE